MATVTLNDVTAQVAQHLDCREQLAEALVLVIARKHGRGVSTTDIAAHLQAVYGRRAAHASAKFVAFVTERL